MQLKHLNQVGDTIVEVLIAIAVVSLILGGAYATVQKSFTTTRDSQERGEALNLAQSQLEMLVKSAGSTTAHDKLKAQTVPFCFANDGNSGIEDTLINATFSNSINPDVNADSVTNYVDEQDTVANRGCRFKPQGGVEYYTATEVTANTYVVHVRWDRIGGGRNEVTLSYRLYL